MVQINTRTPMVKVKINVDSYLASCREHTSEALSYGMHYHNFTCTPCVLLTE